MRNRNEVKDKLAEKGIATGIHYPIALPSLSAYSYLGFKPEDFPVATAYADEILSLPLYAEISEEQVAYVSEELCKIALPTDERKKWWATETIIQKKTGIFFDTQNIKSLTFILEQFNTQTFNKTDCKKQAKNFDESVFESKIQEIINNI